MFEGNTALGFCMVLAIILLTTKLFGLLFRKMGLPQVLGFIIAGILIGPAIFGDFFGFSLIGFAGADYTSFLKLPQNSGIDNALSVFSKIGVLLLMFSAGLETNLQNLKKTGLAAVLMAVAGVVVPFGLGFAVSIPFGDIGLGLKNYYQCLFVGTILTATSVAITVSVLKELGKINTKLGTTIVSAAIIDDVIGIILLSVVTGIANSGSAEAAANGFEAFKSTIYGTVVMVAAFFVFAIVAGIGISKLFRWFDKKWGETHRITIFSLVVCFVYSWLAEEIFGVADITGAFLAGVVLSTDIRASKYADRKIDVCTYAIFAPVFFANIGISNISFSGLDPRILVFAALAVLAGLLGKILGCGLVCKCFRYNLRESAIGGVGMMARGEVALIVTSAVTSSEALGANALGQEFMIMTVLLILVSSILTPIFLKLLYRDKKKNSPPDDGGAGEEEEVPTVASITGVDGSDEEFTLPTVSGETEGIDGMI